MEVTNNVMMLRKTVSGDNANNGVNRANIYQQTKNNNLWRFDSAYISAVQVNNYSLPIE
jgi:hypothetical protein